MVARAFEAERRTLRVRSDPHALGLLDCHVLAPSAAQPSEQDNVGARGASEWMLTLTHPLCPALYSPRTSRTDHLLPSRSPSANCQLLTPVSGSSQSLHCVYLVSRCFNWASLPSSESFHLSTAPAHPASRTRPFASRRNLHAPLNPELSPCPEHVGIAVSGVLKLRIDGCAAGMTPHNMSV